MDYYLLWSFLAGLVGGLLPLASLARIVRSLRLDLAVFETKFLSDQKRKAAQSRWNLDEELKQLQLVPQAPAAPRNRLAKFGIGQKAS